LDAEGEENGEAAMVEPVISIFGSGITVVFRRISIIILKQNCFKLVKKMVLMFEIFIGLH
jgi:hypothetical protein